MKDFVVKIIKPSKYDENGNVERFGGALGSGGGFMSNYTIRHLDGLIGTLDESVRERIDNVEIYDEYVETDLNYINNLHRDDIRKKKTILLLAGAQSHQFHRAIDIAAIAKCAGVEHVAIGGPHVMSSDTSMIHDKGISFSLAEAEVTLSDIFRDAISGQLKSVYGFERKFVDEDEFKPFKLKPPSIEYLKKYAFELYGINHASGCPKKCNYCIVWIIAGNTVRSYKIEATVENIAQAKKAGARSIMFVSDNMNDYKDAYELFDAMIEAKINLPFFIQCTTQITEEFIARAAAAGCFQIFFGVESFDKDILNSIRKGFNRAANYFDIVKWCNKYGVASHFSNIIGFPQQQEKDIYAHLETLLRISSTVVSVYTLTPIPGTDQYADFMNWCWINEKNMDKYDGSNLVFRHPSISKEKMRSLLMWCYRKYMNPARTFARALAVAQKGSLREYWRDFSFNMFYSIFSYAQAMQSRHPMAGGFGRIVLDNVSEYLPCRRKVFGDALENDLLPLPTNLPRHKPSQEELPKEEDTQPEFVQIGKKHSAGA